MVQFSEPVTFTRPIELFEPETRRSMVAFPYPTTVPPTNLFPLPESVIIVCEKSLLVALPVK